MDVIARESRYVTGRTVSHGGAGDSSVLTAYGVFEGMRAAALVAWGRPSLQGRCVGVAGVGKVGHHLVRHLVEDGAEVVVTDVDPVKVAAVERQHPTVRSVASTQELVGEPLDVYAPCALGGAVDATVLEQLKARVVCGGANNQLADPSLDKALADRGIVYAPDFVVNAGGLVQVADEREGFDFERARARVSRIHDVTLEVLREAQRDGVPPGTVAERRAQRRIAAISRLRGIHVP
jgi:valine dehydrogenase (NAD+)